MMTALTAATNLLDRIRDVQGQGLSASLPASLVNGQAYAYKILSEAQRIVNSLEENQITSVPFAITPYQVLYNMSSDPVLGNGGSNQIIRIVGIRDGDVDLNPCPFAQIWQTDLHWFRRVEGSGQPSHTWFKFGMDCFGIYPAMSRAYTFNIIAVPYIADMTTGAAVLSVTDDIIPQVMDMAEAIALFKLGEFKACQIPISRLKTRYKSEGMSDPWRKVTTSE
jgi:hypothetical protein